MSALSPIPRYSLSPIALLLIVMVTAVAVSGCTVTGCNLFNTKYYYDNSYRVTVTGLNNYTGSAGFRILVPVPAINGTPVYTEGQVGAATLIFPPQVSAFADYQTVNESRLVNNTGWTASLVDTEHGQMIALSPNNASLSDVMLILGATKEVPASEREKYSSRPAGDQPLYPVSREYAGSYTALANSSSFGVYSSYVFVDGALTPRQGASAGNFSFSADYHELFAEGSVPAFRQGGRINESIPAGATGWIPVSVQKTE